MPSLMAYMRLPSNTNTKHRFQHVCWRESTAVYVAQTATGPPDAPYTSYQKLQNQNPKHSQVERPHFWKDIDTDSDGICTPVLRESTLRLRRSIRAVDIINGFVGKASITT